MEPRPDVFIQVLRDCGALKAWMPELDALFGVPSPSSTTRKWIPACTCSPFCSSAPSMSNPRRALGLPAA